MNKCLVTKLNGVIQDDSLKKINEFRIQFHSVTNPTVQSQCLYFMFSEDTNLSIIGDGYFTNETFSENNGKTMHVGAWTSKAVYVSNNELELSIDNKYSLFTIEDYRSHTNKWNPNTNSNMEINVAELKYCNLQLFKTGGAIIHGNMSDVSLWTNLTMLSSFIRGDIKSLKNNTNLTHLFVNNAEGDIANLSSLTNLKYIGLDSPKVYGDISSLSSLSSLIQISLKTSQVTGEISSLRGLNKLTTLNAAKVYGDLAVMGAEFVKADLDGSYFTWSSRLPTSKIISINSWGRSSNIDKMLQDQANCVTGITSSTDINNKIIKATGDRTSASDAAIQTLQSKGYSVNITPIR